MIPLSKICALFALLTLPLVSLSPSQTDVPTTSSNDKVEHAQKLYSLAEELYRTGDIQEAIDCSKKAITACEEAGLLQGVSSMLLNIGILHRINSDYTEALKYLYSSLENYSALDNLGGQAMALNQIGSIYRIQGNYPGALEHLLNSLSLFEQVDDTLGRASALNNIGIVYFYQNDLPKALEYYLASLELEELAGSEYGVSISYINIGEVHKKMGNLNEALDFFLKALVLAKKHEESDVDGDSVGILYNEIGYIYTELGDFELSRNYLDRAVEIFRSLSNHQRLAECKIYWGDLAFRMGRYSQATQHYLDALQHAKTISATDLISESNKKLSELYEQLNKPAKAFEHYKTYISARDSLFNEDNMKHMVQTEMLYNFEKQMQEARIEQAKRDVLMLEKTNRQRIVRNMLLLILAMTMVVIVIVFNAYKNKKRSNVQLALQQNQILEKNEELLQQQEEILSQRDEIETKNKILENSQRIIEAKNERIISSIEYAQTIQQAILPNQEQLNKFFPNHVVLFMPKDIVSGDFYWFSNAQDQLFAAVVDCTGHGVPGAFMSVIGNTMLNQIVNEWRTYNPAVILELMHKQVRRVLKQDINDSKGHISMDVCLVSIDLKTRKATFAGASRPLYIVRDGKVERIAGDPRSVGGYQREEKRYFTNHSIDLSESQSLYLTTDGYIDQMDGEFRKFGQKKLIKLLQAIDGKPNEIQHQMLLSALEQHQKEQDQIDDICILGLKL
jgi:serine phosphatase RsbU (regulator of sigma subunit)